MVITTLFGLASLFLDYLVYDSQNNKYNISNYSKFELNHKLKTVSNPIKVNAAKYENNIYALKGYDLIKK